MGLPVPCFLFLCCSPGVATTIDGRQRDDAGAGDGGPERFEAVVSESRRLQAVSPAPFAPAPAPNGTISNTQSCYVLEARDGEGYLSLYGYFPTP